ncbi:DUF1173 family protein (plasmid) [Nocardiopsis eucommiae]|uniref:DUF1173 family protein n=1 Tax=Nocardiopsis eucommiae TaxID=2831970 RepID=A0A975LCR6_9ACTN|nr:DUF1173 family protein [Nocardiopsis eucommiae]
MGTLPPTPEQTRREHTRQQTPPRTDPVRGAPYTPDQARKNHDAYDTWKHGLKARGQRGLLLGEVKTVQESRYGMRVQLSHLHAPIYARTELITRAKRSYRSVWAIQPTFARRLALIAVEPTTRNNLQAIDIAMMLTNHAYLPADSTHEVRMADALIKASRSFVKPLRYDTKESVLPDFVLTDTFPHTCVEVYGMLENPDYRQRQELKREHYKSTGTPSSNGTHATPCPTYPPSKPPRGTNSSSQRPRDRPCAWGCPSKRRRDGCRRPQRWTWAPTGPGTRSGP